MHNVNPMVSQTIGQRNVPKPGTPHQGSPAVGGSYANSPMGSYGQPQYAAGDRNHVMPSPVTGGSASSNQEMTGQSPNTLRGIGGRVSSNGGEMAYDLSGSGSMGAPSYQRRTSSMESPGGAGAMSHGPSHGAGDLPRPRLQTQASYGSGGGQHYNATLTPTQPSYGSSNTGSGQFSSGTTFQPQHNWPSISSLPPPGFSTMSQGADGRMPGTDSMMEGAGIQSSSVFGGGDFSHSRSPFTAADDFNAWLFNSDSGFGPGASPMSAQGAGGIAGLGGTQPAGPQAAYFGVDPMSAYYPAHPPPQHPMAVHSILDTSLPESALSEEKRQQLLELILHRFNKKKDHALVQKQPTQMFEGNMEDERHVLSLNMMQTFVGSYWLHFHPQMPILHRPTFSAATCPDLLLLAMMTLGASCLEKSHGYEVTQACADLSSFLAWHLRWEIFMDAEFRPPAKLWVFQSLLLLEIFEKMYSTRYLHERAHIHHATTLTLMRRGSSLIGRSAMDSPPSAKDAGPASSSSSLSRPPGSVGPGPDEWWNHWITNEATRRAAFAAFVMDSTHATMFGHSAVMVAHEMRLPLPCDEALWSATSAAEAGRVDKALQSNGVKPTTFLDGLKKTLNKTPVRTNSFGRTILMAGLLSVSWHMNQRDLQVSSLGGADALGGRDKWRRSLRIAFDFWKEDFDNSLAPKSGDDGAVGSGSVSASGDTGSYANGLEDSNASEGRTVLHHLAHMAMHVDIVDCQIYAGAGRLLGRSITKLDYSRTARRMKEDWAPYARARDAVFFALGFLRRVLVPEDFGGSHRGSNPHLPHASPSTGPLPPPQRSRTPGSTVSEPADYSAREDFLLNRPWMLYFATLIVWSYGYALDGPLSPPYPLPTPADRVRDMQCFLRRVGGVHNPEELGRTENRNACLGLLVVMHDMFRRTRWELLHEGSSLLAKCIDMLAGSGASAELLPPGGARTSGSGQGIS